MSGIDVDGITAIDVHTHTIASTRGEQGDGGAQGAGLDAVFGPSVASTLPELAQYYRERKMAAVTFTVDQVDQEGGVTNEEIFELAAEHTDVILPFASVDPRRGAEGVRMARRLIEDYDVRGFKFHPSVQAFFPNDAEMYPLYEVIAEHRLPALFHSGQTAVGARQPGGAGIRLKYSNPMLVDDVAADFPDMPIILAHPSVPWQDEAIAVALHKTQVYIDLSGWSPKYFPATLVQHANTLLRERVLFGTDYPSLTVERWMKDFDTLEMRPGVRELILKENAVRLFGLRPAG